MCLGRTPGWNMRSQQLWLASRAMYASHGWIPGHMSQDVPIARYGTRSIAHRRTAARAGVASNNSQAPRAATTTFFPADSDSLSETSLASQSMRMAQPTLFGVKAGTTSPLARSGTHADGSGIAINPRREPRSVSVAPNRMCDTCNLHLW